MQNVQKIVRDLKGRKWSNMNCFQGQKFQLIVTVFRKGVAAYIATDVKLQQSMALMNKNGFLNSPERLKQQKIYRLH
jgi:hypothetical protein